MTRNLGKLDRILRFLLAFWWLGPLAPQYEIPWVNLLLAVIGWIALAESFIGWCWLHKIFGVGNQSQ